MLPKHQLGIKDSDIWPYGGHFLFKSQYHRTDIQETIWGHVGIRKLVEVKFHSHDSKQLLLLLLCFLLSVCLPLFLLLFIPLSLWLVLPLSSLLNVFLIIELIQYDSQHSVKWSFCFTFIDDDPLHSWCFSSQLLKTMNLLDCWPLSRIS